MDYHVESLQHELNSVKEGGRLWDLAGGGPSIWGLVWVVGD